MDSRSSESSTTACCLRSTCDSVGQGIARLIHSMCVTGERRRVLLIEESEVIRLLTSHLLTGQQFEVITADTAAAGLAQANVFLPDLMLIDEVMQSENAHQLMARLALDPRL